MTTNDILKDYIIYKIYCKNKEINDEYYGHTSAFRNRKYIHKNCCNNENRLEYNTEKYKIIRDNGGWHNWEMVPIEEIKNCSLINAKIREQYHIDLNKSTMNKNYAYITEEQIKEKAKIYRKNNKEVLEEKAKIYYENNKEVIAEKAKIYCENNKEVRGEKAKIYRKNNKEVIAEYGKNYRSNNKEVIAEKAKIYRKNNKEKIEEKHKEKITCACGSTFRIDAKSKHERTNKHCEFILKQLN
jgi:hypothetical protein